MEERLERARKRVRDAEANLVEEARPVLTKIAEQCAKLGILVRSDLTDEIWSMEIKKLGVRSKEVSDFCNGALSEPVGGSYLLTHTKTLGDGGRYDTIQLTVRREYLKTTTVIPAAVDLWSEILADARTRAHAAAAEMHEAARDLVDVLFVSAMPEGATVFNVVFNHFENNSNLHVEAFLKLAARSTYWPSSFGYKKVLFAQTLDAFQRDIRETGWHVEWHEERGDYTITAIKPPRETQ